MTPAERIARAVRHAVADHYQPVDLYPYIIGLAERPLLEATLRRYGGNLSRAAVALGINRNTLRKKMREHKIV